MVNDFALHQWLETILSLFHGRNWLFFEYHVNLTLLSLSVYIPNAGVVWLQTWKTCTRQACQSGPWKTCPRGFVQPTQAAGLGGGEFVPAECFRVRSQSFWSFEHRTHMEPWQWHVKKCLANCVGSYHTGRWCAAAVKLNGVAGHLVVRRFFCFLSWLEGPSGERLIEELENTRFLERERDEGIASQLSLNTSKGTNQLLYHVNLTVGDVSCAALLPVRHWRAAPHPVRVR